MVDGLSKEDALRETIWDWGKKYADIAGGTLFSSGVMSGAPALGSTIADRSNKKSYGKSVAQKGNAAKVLDMAAAYPEDSSVGKLYKRYSDKGYFKDGAKQRPIVIGNLADRMMEGAYATLALEDATVEQKESASAIISQLESFAKTSEETPTTMYSFGENGKKQFEKFKSEVGSALDDEAIEGFSKFYEAGRNGLTLEQAQAANSYYLENFPKSVKGGGVALLNSAFYSGQNDRENGISAASQSFDEAESSRKGDTLEDSSIVLERDENKYPYNEQEVIEGYEDAVDNRIMLLAEKIRKGQYNENDSVEFGKTGSSEIQAVSKILGIDVSGYDSVVEARQIRHIITRHGINGKADKSMRNDEDIARLKFVIDNYDDAFYGGTSSAYTTIKQNGKPREADTVVFAKKINGTYFVVQAVPQTKKKKLFVVSAFISDKPLDEIKEQFFNKKQKNRTSRDASLRQSSKTSVVTSEAAPSENSNDPGVQNQKKDSSSLVGTNSSADTSISENGTDVKRENNTGDRNGASAESDSGYVPMKRINDIDDIKMDSSDRNVAKEIESNRSEGEIDYDDNTPDIGDIKKATGFGDDGAQLVAELMSKGKSLEEVQKAVKPMYIAGFTGGDVKRAKTDIQKRAFDAGTSDKVAQREAARSKAKKATVRDGSLIENEASGKLSKVDREIIKTVAKDLGLSVSVAEKIVVARKNGVEYEADARHRDGELTLTGARPVFRLVLHEAGHRMEQLATEEWNTLCEALYERAEQLGRRMDLGATDNLRFDRVKGLHDKAGITMDTSGYVGEVVMRELETIFSSPEEYNKWLSEISSNRKVKSAWRKFMDFVSGIIKKLRNALKNVGLSKDARAQMKSELAELERIRGLYAEAYKATGKAVAERKAEIDTERVTSNELDVSYSLKYNGDIAEGQLEWLDKNKGHITEAELKDAQEVTKAMVDVMMKHSEILPEDKIGKVLTKNGSYDRSVENTTICVRTLAYNEFVDKVQEEIGRPLTQMESFLVSQKLYDITTEPQCLYCYVSLDRKAFNDMLLRFMSERDTVIAKYNNSDKSAESIKKLYEEFLHGRKDTKEMKSRFDKWLDYVDNGTQLLSLADIATEERQSDIKAKGGILAEQLADARKYAQSASWSKIQKNYVAYRDEILKLGDRVVKNLNEHYGLRWYSFSDYSAAFIVENMQQITDASIRGLKGLAYTKDTDFVEIFAPTGMNINVSVFVNQDADGNFFIDEKQSANFEKAVELRKKYPNVGIVATVTNDEALRWAGEQEWSDVIIPFHIVRTGTDVAEYYKWLNYTGESGDTIADKNLWDAYVKSLNLSSENARKKVSKNIYPSEHKNNKDTYLSLCESRGLSPRFARFAGEAWYMKLVNETRLSADDSSSLKPEFNLDAAKDSFQKFIDKGGYEGGWYKEGVDVDAEAKTVADDVLAGKKANEVEYGRQDGFAPEEIIANRKSNRTHGKNSGVQLSERLSKDDLEEYIHAGTRTNIKKQEALAEGKKIILTTEDEITSFIHKSISGDDLNTVGYGRVNKRLSNDVDEYSNGKIDISGNFLELVPYDISHAYREHLNAKEDGDINLSMNDFENIPSYIDHYDELVYAIRFKSGNTRICLSKKLPGGRVLIIETVSKSRGSIAFKNMIGVSEEKYINKYMKIYKKRNSTNTRGSKNSNISLRDDTVSNNSILNSPQKNNGKIVNNEDVHKSNYSIKEEGITSSEDTKELLNTIADLKHEFEITKFAKADPKKLSEMVRSILKDYSSKADSEAVMSAVDELYTYMANGVDGNPPVWNEVYSRALDIASGIVDNAVKVDDTAYREYADLRNYLRNVPMKFDVRYDGVPSGYSNFNEFRKKNFGRLRFSNDGLSVDSIYQELAEMYPQFFDKDNEITTADQLERIVEVLDEIRPIEANPFAAETKEAARYLANDILDRFFNIRQTPTFSSEAERRSTEAKLKQIKELNKTRGQRDIKIQKLRNIYDSIIKNVNDEKTRALESQKAKHNESLAKMSESRRTTEMRTRIFKHASELNQRLVRGTDNKHIPQELQGAVLVLLESINLESNIEYVYGKDAMYHRVKRNTELGGESTKKTQAFNALRDIYSKLEGYVVIDPDLLGPDGILSEVINLADKRITDMTIPELNTVWKAIKAIEASVRSADKMFSAGKFRRVSDAAEGLRADNADKSAKKDLRYGAGLQKLIGLDMLTPETYFHYLGDTGDQIFRMMRDAQDKHISIMKEVADFTHEAMEGVNIKKLEKELKTVKLGGKEVTLTTAQLMELYTLMKRSQAKEHVFVGGILPDTIKGHGLHDIKAVEPVTGISQAEILDALMLLTEDQRKLADKLQEYASTVLGKYGNEASLQVYNYEKFHEKNYWPIRTNKQEISTDIEKDTAVSTVANKGMAKVTVPDANTSLRIGSIFDTFASHASDMATYAAWLGTTEDINRIRNFVFWEDGVRTGTVKGILGKVHGSRGAEYLQNLLADISVGVKSTNTMNPFEKLMGNYKAASIGSNFRVIIQQPTAILRAVDMMGAQWFAPAFVKNPLKGWDKAKKYAPIAQWKDWGYFDINTGRQMKDVLFDNASTGEKIKQFEMSGAGFADSISWGFLWNAVEAEIKSKHKGLEVESEAYYKAVAERFTEVTDHTQVVDGILQRSQIMRSGDTITKMATSFMGEPTKQYNMVASALYDVTNKPGKGKSKAIKHFGRMALALAISGVVNSAAQSIIDAMRDDDKEKKYWERWLTAFPENLKDTVNVVNYIPFVKDIVSIVQGYDVKRMDMETIAKTYKACENMIKSLKGEGKNTILESSLNLFAELARLGGYSVSNIKRMFTSIADTFAIETDNYLMQYHMEKAVLDINFAGNRSSFIDILYNAYNNDREAYEIIYNDLIENGITEKQIQSGMETRMKNAAGISKVSDLDKRYMSPDDERKYDSILEEIQASEAWKSANKEQRKNAEADLFAIIASTSDDMEKKRKEAAEYGVDETEYVLWQLAKDMADDANDNNGSMNAKEKGDAIGMLPGLGDSEIAYFYATEGADKVYETGMDMRSYAEFKGATADIKGDGKKNAIADTILQMDVDDDAAWDLYLTEYDNKSTDYARDNGIEGNTYLKFVAALCDVDKPTDSGKYGTYTQDEAKEAINSIPGLTREEKAILWQSVNPQWKEKNNPFR